MSHPDPDPDPDSEVATLDAARLAELLQIVSRSRRRQEAYIDVFADAALLAAQQVQDQRLDLVESGPEVTATDVFFDVLLSLALDSNVAGRLISFTTGKLLGRVLRTRAAFAVVPRSRLGHEVSLRLKASPLDEAGRVRVTKRFLEGADGRRLYKEVVYEMTEGASDLAAKQGQRALGRGLRTRPERFRAQSPEAARQGAVPPLAGDSPGVAVQDRAQLFSSRQKEAVNVMHDYLESVLVSGETGGDASVQEVIAFIEEELGSSVVLWADIATIKDRYKRFFEMCIWVQLLPPNLEWTTQKTVGGDEVTLPKVPSRLTRYFVERFPYPGSERGESFLEHEVTQLDDPAKYGYDELDQAGIRDAARRGAVIRLAGTLNQLRRRLEHGGLTVVEPPDFRE